MWCSLNQGCDDSTEGQKTLIDLPRLPCTFVHSSRPTDVLTPCEINLYTRHPQPIMFKPLHNANCTISPLWEAEYLRSCVAGNSCKLRPHISMYIHVHLYMYSRAGNFIARGYTYQKEQTGTYQVGLCVWAHQCIPFAGFHTRGIIPLSYQ